MHSENAIHCAMAAASANQIASNVNTVTPDLLPGSRNPFKAVLLFRGTSLKKKRFRFKKKLSQWSLEKKKVQVLVSMDLIFLAFLYLAARNVVPLPWQLRLRLALSIRKT